ncbi:hypothetical protein Q8F55_004517 [Vanrija albida]|uniref:Uncharacterized protein n=1 Tax=Vanrija albida TaxID=181172 RepID=A0ABR3Q700_9TREE
MSFAHHTHCSPDFDYEGYAAYELSVASYHERALAAVLKEHRAAERRRQRTARREAEAMAVLASLKNLNLGYVERKASLSAQSTATCPSLSSSPTSSAASSPATSPADVPPELLEWAGAGGKVRMRKS